MHMFVSVALHNNALLFFFFSQQVLNYVLCTRARTRFYWSCRRRLYKHLIVTTRWKHRQTASSLSWSRTVDGRTDCRWPTAALLPSSSAAPGPGPSAGPGFVPTAWCCRLLGQCLCKQVETEFSLDSDQSLCKQVEMEYSLDSDHEYPSLQEGWNTVQAGFWSMCAIQLNSKCSLDSDQCLCKQVELKT